MHRWRIRIALPLPDLMEAEFEAGPPGAGPSAMRHVRWLQRSATLAVGSSSARLQAWKGPGLPPQLAGAQVADLSLWIDAHDARDALDAATPLLEDLVDGLTFQLQRPITPVQLEVIDVTLPAVPGDERAGLLLPFPQGFVPSTYFRTEPTPGPAVRTNPELKLLKPSSRKARAAFSWYVKALHTQYDADRFVMLTVALDLLYQASNIRVDEPYVAPCKHTIAECPKCMRSTARPVLGRGIRKFLTDRLGILDADAKRIWELRQIVHGDSDPKTWDLADLAMQTHGLQAALGDALKSAVGFGPDDSPQFRQPDTAVGPRWLGVTRPLSDSDFA